MVGEDLGDEVDRDVLLTFEDDLGMAVLDGLASLLNKSLVRRQGEDDAKPRLLLLETLREFASERLRASGKAEAVAARHAAYFLTLAREVGLVPHTAWALAGLGLAAVYQGAGERAVPLLQESLQLAQDLRDRYTIAECLSGLASVAADRTELPRAARLWGAAERLHQLLGAGPPSTRSLHHDRLAAVREQLGTGPFQRALTKGMNMPTDLAVADALAM